MQFKRFPAIYIVRVYPPEETESPFTFGTPEVEVFPRDDQVKSYIDRHFMRLTEAWYPDRTLFKHNQSGWLYDITEIGAKLVKGIQE